MLFGIFLFVIGVFIATQNTQSKIAWPLIIVGLVLIALPVRAEHPPEHMALHEQFYKKWMMPDNRSVSCCHDQDCKPAEAHKIGNDWYARQEGDEKEFTKIPPNKVDLGLPDSPDNPDGRNHLCGRRYGFSTGDFTVFCFQPAAGY